MERFTAELPGLEEAWQVGLIVGPSGSGKSTIARAAWPWSYSTALRRGRPKWKRGTDNGAERQPEQLMVDGGYADVSADP